MARMLMGSAVAIVAFIGNMFCVPDARACQCEFTGPNWFTSLTVEELLAQYDFDAVFSGEVVSPDVTESDGGLVQHMHVLEVWQGRVYQEQELNIFSPCEVSLPEGQEYIIFANLRDDDLWISWCSPYIALSEADEVLQQLGLGEPPLPGTSDPSTCGLAGIFPILLTFTGFLFFVKRASPQWQRDKGLPVGQFGQFGARRQR